ncbi:MAG: hypothetical protein WD645_01690 [Dehalococcoidia bacterium]
MKLRFGVLAAVSGSLFLGLIAACSTAEANPQTLMEQGHSFQEGLDGWAARANLVPSSVVWEAAAMNEPSSDEAGSAQVDIDASGGAGVVWLQQRFPVDVKAEAEVVVEVVLRARAEGDAEEDVQLVFWSKRSAPLDRNSFDNKEALVLDGTWREYTFTETVQVPGGGGPWIAFGVEVAEGSTITVNFDEVNVKVDG